MELPASLNKDLHTVAEEVAYARSLTPEQRLQVVARACRATSQLLSMHPKRHQVLTMRDPVPVSTTEAWRRLAATA